MASSRTRDDGGFISMYDGRPVFYAGIPRHQVGDELVFDQDPQYRGCLFRSSLNREHVRMSNYKYDMLKIAGFRGTVISIDKDSGMYEMDFAGEGWFFPECMVVDMTKCFDISEGDLLSLLE